MNREQAHEYLKLYLQFLQADTGIKITDCDPALDEVELTLPVPDGRRIWTDLWDAAKIIEAHSA